MSSDVPLIELKDITNDSENLKNSNDTKKPESGIEIQNQKSKKNIIILISIIFIIIIGVTLLLVFLLKSKDKSDKKEDEIEDKIPVIFDVDEGGDDMMAYVLANNSKKYNILGITTVSPAYTVDNVTDIWLKFLDYMDFDVKVYKGENHPIHRTTEPQEFYHDYQIDFNETNKTCENISAVDFMVDSIIRSKKKVTLFLLAPLTNFALAFQKNSNIIDNIEEIIIMGGTKEEGNMQYNSKAEYNIYQDSEAANIVFNCGIKIKVIGTDVTHKTFFTDEIYDKYLEYNTRSSILSYCVMKGTFITWHDNYVHDPATVIYHLNRDIIQLKDYYAEVNTTNPDVNGTNYGTIYFNEPTNISKANIEYSESINLDLYWETFNNLMQKY